jgi:hypothetical protein
MEEQISVSLKRIKSIIDKKITIKTFTTADILREYSGGFYCNVGTPPIFSFNAQFGKILKRNENKLNIKEIRPKVIICDDNGRKTKSSVWKLNT